MKTTIRFRHPQKYELVIGDNMNERIIKTLPTKQDAQTYRINVESPELAHLVSKIQAVAPNHLPRLIRGAELVLDRAVVGNGAPDTYYVTSSTSKHRIYRVHIPEDDPDGWTCHVHRDPYHPEVDGTVCPDIESPDAPLTNKGRKRCKHMCAAYLRSHLADVEDLDEYQIVDNAEWLDKKTLCDQIKADRAEIAEWERNFNSISTTTIMLAKAAGVELR